MHRVLDAGRALLSPPQTPQRSLAQRPPPPGLFFWERRITTHHRLAFSNRSCTREFQSCMQFSDDDLALVRNALFAYGLANADTPQGMRAQELYRLLRDANELGLAREQQQQPHKVLRRQRAVAK